MWQGGNLQISTKFAKRASNFSLFPFLFIWLPTTSPALAPLPSPALAAAGFPCSCATAFGLDRNFGLCNSV
jgi:hypothetical protein